MALNPADIQKYLRGIDFPANKDELIEYAQNMDAPKEIMNALENIAEKTYNNAADLTKEVASAIF